MGREHIEEFGSWNAECGKNEFGRRGSGKGKTMEPGNNRTKNQSFERCALYPTPSALSFRIPNSDFGKFCHLFSSCLTLTPIGRAADWYRDG
jgi:hypothetical protein